MMLFRRSKWTKQFLEAVAELGRVPEPELGEVRPLTVHCPTVMRGKCTRSRSAIPSVLDADPKYLSIDG